MAAHSAASLQGLPGIEPRPRHVVVLDVRDRIGPSRYIRPRIGAPGVPVVIGGVRATPAARTVIDPACTGSLDDVRLLGRAVERTALFERRPPAPARPQL